MQLHSLFYSIFLNILFGHKLSGFGIYPRKISGLIGIPLSPFLHFSLRHVMLNTVPFLILGGLVALKGSSKFLEISLFIIFAAGLLTWLFGRSSFHAGASGLIFGYFGFLVANGWYSGDLKSMAISAITIFLYSGMISGIFPTFKSVSWEGHLFGLVSGVAYAYFSRF